MENKGRHGNGPLHCLGGGAKGGERKWGRERERKGGARRGGEAERVGERREERGEMSNPCWVYFVGGVAFKARAARCGALLLCSTPGRR